MEVKLKMTCDSDMDLMATSGPGPLWTFCGELACSPCVCVSFLQVIRFPPPRILGEFSCQCRWPVHWQNWSWHCTVVAHWPNFTWRCTVYDCVCELHLIWLIWFEFHNLSRMTHPNRPLEDERSATNIKTNMTVWKASETRVERP